MDLNVCATSKHISAIEIRIRVIKERHRTIRHGLPYACIPKLMVIELNNYITHYVNAFPAKGGVSMTLSPGTVVTGLTIDCKNHCRLEFGEYVQTYENNAPRNNTQARSLGAFALGPTHGYAG